MPAINSTPIHSTPREDLKVGCHNTSSAVPGTGGSTSTSKGTTNNNERAKAPSSHTPSTKDFKNIKLGPGGKGGDGDTKGGNGGQGGPVEFSMSPKTNCSVDNIETGVGGKGGHGKGSGGEGGPGGGFSFKESVYLEAAFPPRRGPKESPPVYYPHQG